jgi:hypothetical protein
LSLLSSSRISPTAPHISKVSDLPYTAPPLSCVAFFVKEQARSSQQAAERGTLLVVISNLE